MVAQIKEVQLVDPVPFMCRTQRDIKKAPINYGDYEKSQINIQKLIRKLTAWKSRRKVELSERINLVTQISKLKTIEKDLQKALES